MFPRLIFPALMVAFFLNSVLLGSPALSGEIVLPQPGRLVLLSQAHEPPRLTGLKVDANNPFRLEFVLEQGPQPVSPRVLQTESRKLLKYFLAALTTPQRDMWVNLSPYEQNRMAAKHFRETELGRDLLAQDYMLKQVSASLMYPEHALGQSFWQKVYQQARQTAGGVDLAVKTYNKVWIVPQKAVVYENTKTRCAYVVESSLNVLLEEDYLAQRHNRVAQEPAKSKAMRELIIPALIQEINEGKNFAPLRQMYHSLILATWYKKKIRKSLLAQVYVDQNKVQGVAPLDQTGAKRIYDRYIEAFKKGAYDYIKEETLPEHNQTIARRYFSGGIRWDRVKLAETSIAPSRVRPKSSTAVRLLVDLAMISGSSLKGSGPAQDAEEEAASRPHASVLGHRWGFWRAVLTFLWDYQKGKRTAAQNRLFPRTHDRMLYYIALELTGISAQQARDLGMEQLLLLWLRYVRLGDAILDHYGALFSVEELERMLVADRFPIISPESLKAKGIHEQELKSMQVKTIDPQESRSPAELLKDFPHRAETLIQQMPVDTERKQKLRTELINISNELFASYVFERKNGPYPAVDQVLAVHKAKGALVGLARLQEVFISDKRATLIIQNQELLMAFSVLIQMFDDYTDLTDDYGWQPNLVLSIAAHQYPEEFSRLQSAFANRLRGPSGLHETTRLMKLAPQTQRAWFRYAYAQFKKVFQQKPLMASLVAGYSGYKFFVDKFIAHRDKDSAMNQAKSTPDINVLDEAIQEIIFAKAKDLDAIVFKSRDAWEILRALDRIKEWEHVSPKDLVRRYSLPTVAMGQDYVARVVAINALLDKNTVGRPVNTESLDYIDKSVSYLNQAVIDRNRGRIKEFERVILPKIARLGHPLAKTLPHADDWLAYAVMHYDGDGKPNQFIERVKALAELRRPWAAALLFAAIGPHTRTHFISEDKHDLEAQKILIGVFHKNVSQPIYAHALLNGLLARASEDFTIGLYESHVEDLEKIVSRQGGDLRQMVRQVTAHVNRPAWPGFIRYGRSFGYEEINRFSFWSNHLKLGVSQERPDVSDLFADLTPRRIVMSYIKAAEAEADTTKDDFFLTNVATQEQMTLQWKFLKKWSAAKPNARSSAMTATPGGIDFQEDRMQLQTQQAGDMSITIDPAMLAQYEKATGFEPASIRIQALPDLAGFLGVTR